MTVKINKQPSGRIETCLTFLRNIATHNNREWFHEHKPEYDVARAAFESLVEELIASIATFDSSIQYLQASDCTFRFYRDIRFSPDKSPYKRNFGAYINAKGKKAIHGGYYIHLEPENCMLAGGSYCIPSPILRAIRESICEQPETFHQLVSRPPFRTLFPTIGEEHIKTTPKGFPKDFPYPEYLRCKDYTCYYRVSDDFFKANDWMSQAVQIFEIMKPFLDFINNIIDDYE